MMRLAQTSPQRCWTGFFFEDLVLLPMPNKRQGCKQGGAKFAFRPLCWSKSRFDPRLQKIRDLTLFLPPGHMAVGYNNHNDRKRIRFRNFYKRGSHLTLLYEKEQNTIFDHEQALPFCFCVPRHRVLLSHPFTPTHVVFISLMLFSLLRNSKFCKFRVLALCKSLRKVTFWFYFILTSQVTKNASFQPSFFFTTFQQDETFKRLISQNFKSRFPPKKLKSQRSAL